VSTKRRKKISLKEIAQCDEDDVTRTCIRDLAAATKSCLGYHPDLNLLPPPKRSDLCSARLGAALRFSRTTKSLSQPKSPQHQLQSSDLSHPLGAN